MPQPQLLQQGQPVFLINGTAIGAQTSDLFCIPGKPGQNVPNGNLLWRSSYTGGPSAVNVVLEGNADGLGVNWDLVDTTTNTAGESRSIIPVINYRFYRVRMVSNTGGTLITVLVSIG